MRKLSLLFILFSPLLSFGQLIENFSDGDFTNNPTWTGNISNFFINNSFQLQSKAPMTSTSFLFTPSETIDDAIWEVWVKITYTTSSSNYASVYIVSNTNDIAFTIDKADLTKASEILEKIKVELGVGVIHVDEDIAKVSIVGEGMVDRPGIAATMFDTIAGIGVNIKKDESRAFIFDSVFQH